MQKTKLMKQGEKCRLMATGAALVLIAVLLTHIVGLSLWNTPVSTLLAAMLLIVPLLLYLIAILDARRAFGLLAKGDSFPDVMPNLLRRVGLIAILGGGFRLAAQAALLRLIDPERFSAILTFDAAALALIIMGVLLILISSLFKTTVEMRRELYEIV